MQIDWEYECAKAVVISQLLDYEVSYMEYPPFGPRLMALGQNGWLWTPASSPFGQPHLLSFLNQPHVLWAIQKGMEECGYWMGMRSPCGKGWENKWWCRFTSHEIAPGDWRPDNKASGETAIEAVVKSAFLAVMDEA